MNFFLVRKSVRFFVKEPLSTTRSIGCLPQLRHNEFEYHLYIYCSDIEIIFLLPHEYSITSWFYKVINEFDKNSTVSSRSFS